MAQSIDEFVKQLRADGVDAGKAAAEKLLSDAKAEAARLVAAARAEGEAEKKCLADEGAREKTRHLAELELACRDLMIQVRDNLAKGFEQIARDKVTAQARSPEFIRQALLHLVRDYAMSPGSTVRAVVQQGTVEELQQWAQTEVNELVKSRGGKAFVLAGGLRSAGCTLGSDDQSAVVEVTVDSVMDALKAIVSPELGQVLRKAREKSA